LPSCGISIYGTEVVARFAAANPVEGDLVVLERVLQTAASAGAASLNRREVDSCRVDVCVVRRIDVDDLVISGQWDVADGDELVVDDGGFVGHALAGLRIFTARELHLHDPQRFVLQAVQPVVRNPDANAPSRVPHA